jgi:hypothetical protein
MPKGYLHKYNKTIKAFSQVHAFALYDYNLNSSGCQVLIEKIFQIFVYWLF